MTDKFLRPAQAIGVLIALGGASFIVYAREFGLEPSSVLDRRIMSTVAVWGLVLILFAWTAIAEQRPIGSIGFPRPTLKGAAIGFAVGLGLIVAPELFAMIFPAAGSSSPATEDPGGLFSLPLWMRSALALTAGFTEEILFRGYPITRLKELTGSTVFAAGLPLAVFVLIHLPTFGLDSLILYVISGGIFTALFLWRKDLWTNIIANFIVNFSALVIGPELAAMKPH